MIDKNAKASGKASPAKAGHPDACTKTTRKSSAPLRHTVEMLRAWRRKRPNALQLDGHPTGRNNLKPWIYIRLDGFSSPRHDFLTKHSKELIEGDRYNGVWNLHGDAKVEAIDELLRLFESGGDPLEFLSPSATYEAKAEHAGAQYPKLMLRGVTGANAFYLYQD
jgi:hypothetical protein